MDINATSRKVSQNENCHIAGPKTRKNARFSQPPPSTRTEKVANHRPRALSCHTPSGHLAQKLTSSLTSLTLTQIITPHVGHEKSPRLITAGDINIGPTRQLSLELETSLDAAVSLKTSDNNIHARKIRDAIRDDGERRIQLLYYQLLAYWKEGCQISLGKTLYQHGIATSPRCSAAHAAILPNLDDNHLDVLAKHIEDVGITNGTHTKMRCLGFSEEDIKKIKHAAKPEIAFQDFIKSFPEKQSLLGNKVHLYHTNACTIDMPAYVNEFHTLFEHRFRIEALKYLNDVSIEGKDPYESLEKLCDYLNDFLIKAKAQTEKKIPLVKKLLEIELEWKKLQLQLLDNKVEDKEAFMLSYLGIGAQIVDTVALIKEYSGQSLYARTSHLDSYFAFVNSNRSLLLESGKAVRRSKASKSKSQQERLEDAYANLCTSLARLGQITNSNLEQELSDLANSTVVIDILTKASSCPPKHALSGTFDSGKWVTFTPEQIMEQKYQIISQRSLDVIVDRNLKEPAR